MPIFTITEKGVDKPRVVEAKSREAALNFVLADRFAVDIVKRPSDMAKLYGQGCVLEDSEAAPAQKSEVHEGAGKAEANAEADGKGAVVAGEGDTGDGKIADAAKPPTTSPRSGAKAPAKE